MESNQIQMDIHKLYSLPSYLHNVYVLQVIHIDIKEWVMIDYYVWMFQLWQYSKRNTQRYMFHYYEKIYTISICKVYINSTNAMGSSGFKTACSQNVNTLSTLHTCYFPITKMTFINIVIILPYMRLFRYTYRRPFIAVLWWKAIRMW